MEAYADRYCMLCCTYLLNIYVGEESQSKMHDDVRIEHLLELKRSLVVLMLWLIGGK